MRRPRRRRFVFLVVVLQRAPDRLDRVSDSDFVLERLSYLHDSLFSSQSPTTNDETPLLCLVS